MYNPNFCLMFLVTTYCVFLFLLKNLINPFNVKELFLNVFFSSLYLIYLRNIFSSSPSLTLMLAIYFCVQHNFPYLFTQFIYHNTIHLSIQLSIIYYLISIFIYYLLLSLFLQFQKLFECSFSRSFFKF